MARATAVLCALLLVFPALADVTRTEGREGQEGVITLENEHLRLVIFPDLGGRIGHLIDLDSGDDLLYWDLSPDSVYGGLGGALDDRRNTFERYEPTLPDDRPGSVRLLYESDDVTIEKTIALEEGMSSIRVDYRFANVGQQDLTDYDVMTKNFLLPSGEPVSERDLYCLSTTHGVRQIQAFSGNWRRYPELRGKFKDNVGPWNAFVSTASHRAIAAAFSSDYYRWFYFWKNGVEFPTYEWVFRPLPAGTQTTVTLWLHVVPGLDAVTHADRAVVADTRLDAGELRTSVFAAAEPMQGARLETRARRLPGEDWQDLGAIELPDLPLAALHTAAIPWQPEDGTWVVHQRILDGGQAVSEWELPIVVGEAGGEYVRGLQFPEHAEPTAIPGWQREEVQDIARPTAADRERGLLVYLDEFAPEQQRGLQLERYVLHMGQGEAKSLGMHMRALQDLQNVTVTADSPHLPPEQIELFGVEYVDVSNESVGKSELIGRKLIPWSMADLSAGDDVELWLRVRTTEEDRGDIPLTLTVRARGREPAVVELPLDVRPVPLPRPNLISHEAEHQMMGLPGCWNAEEGRWNEEVLERYARDLGEHLVDFEQGFWGWFRYSRHPEHVLLDDGRTLREWKASDPAPDETPRLDFSYLNPVFDAAIRHGLVRFSTNSSSSLPPEHVPGHVMAEAARYLRDRGYPDRDIWCKHMDEQPATNYPRMAEEVGWLVEHGWRPYSTFHNVLANGSHMAILQPRFDMFQGGFSNREDLKARLQDGTLEPGDEVWMYQGWGATWRSYTGNRRPGWFAAAAGLDGYHVHVYYRWSMTDAVIFPSEQGPADTPAWEGMRDGLADAQWVALARRWTGRLDRASQDRPALARVAADARARLRSAVGGEGAAIALAQTRDRLHHVDRIEEFDVPAAERARAIVLDLLADLRPRVRSLGPSLYYGRHTLAEEGDVLLRIAPTADRHATELLGALLRERFGVAPRLGRSWPGEFALDLRIADTSGWERSDLHVTDRYPPAGEYLIHLEEGGPEQPARMLIYGRDRAGLEKGIRNWLHFLRSERPGAARGEL